jgi:hypothetical protein
MLALVIEKVTNLSYQGHEKIVFKPLEMTNTYVFDYEKTNQLQHHLIGNFSKIGILVIWVFWNKNIYYTKRFINLIWEKFSEFFPANFCKKAFIGYSNEHKGKK